MSSDINDNMSGYNTLITTSRTYIELSTTRRPFRGYDFPMDLSSFSVPLAVTLVVCLVLCMVVVYTKARRRRQRASSGARNNLSSISGGVPTNVHAYRNYGMHLSADHVISNQVSRNEGFPGDQPPPYEVAISAPPSGGYATPLQPYAIYAQQALAPPPYSSSVPCDTDTTISVDETTHNNIHQEILNNGNLPSSNSVTQSRGNSTDTAHTNHRPDTVIETEVNDNADATSKENNKVFDQFDSCATESVPKPDSNVLNAERPCTISEQENQNSHLNNTEPIQHPSSPEEGPRTTDISLSR